MSNNLKKLTINGASWNFSKMILTHGRTFIVSIILARILEPSDFGIIGMAMIFASLTDTIVDLGLGVAIIQKKNVTEEQKSTVFFLNLVMGLILGGIMYITSTFVSVFFEMPELEGIIKFLSLTFLIKGLTSLQRTLMNKEMDFKSPFVSELVSGIVSSIFGIYLALIGHGVWSLIYSQALGWVLNTIIIWRLSKWRPMLCFNLNSVKELWSFGSKSALTTFLDVAFNRIDTIVIGKIFDAATLGVFYKAKSLVRITVQYSFGAFSSVLFPALSKINDNIHRQKKILFKIINITGFTSFFVSGLLLVNAHEIIVILYTDKWIESVPLLKILGFFTFTITFSSVFSSSLLSAGRSSELMKVEILKRILTLFTIPIGIYFGLYLFLISGFIIGNIGLLLYMVLIMKHFGIKIKHQIVSILDYFFPFIFLLVLFYFMDLEVKLDKYLSIILKSFLYILFYMLYCWLRKMEGFLIVKNLVAGKIFKKNGK